MNYPYKIGTMIKLGRRSFIVKGYNHLYNSDKSHELQIELSRPYLDGIRQKAGYALRSEKELILKGFAEIIKDDEE